MKKLLPLAIISMFALGGCMTTDTSDKSNQKTTTEKPEICSSDPDNPQCGTGGPAGGGPITRVSDDCPEGEMDENGLPCGTGGTGGPVSGGPITRR